MSTESIQSTREEILQELQESGDAFMTATEIANIVGATRQNVKYHLDQLKEQGVVEKKQAGSRAVGWWAT